MHVETLKLNLCKRGVEYCKVWEVHYHVNENPEVKMGVRISSENAKGRGVGEGVPLGEKK